MEEMQRRELEAELGSARAMALLEAENKRRVEEQLEQERLRNVESLKATKERVGELAWEQWTSYFSEQSTLAMKMDIDGGSNLTENALSLEEISEEERAALLKDFKPFRVRSPHQRNCLQLKLDARLFSEDE